MATLRTVYVDPDVSGGAGNGTSWANAYSSLNAAEQAQDDTGDLVSRDEYIEFHCGHNGASQSTADTTAVSVDGWTTDATRYIEILTETADRHNGTPQTTKYRLTLGTTGTSNMSINEPFVRVTGLQLLRSGTSGQCFFVAGNQGTSGFRISKCILQTTSGNGWVDNYNSTSTTIWNCLIQDVGTGVYGIRFYNAAGSANTVYNCTITGYDTGAVSKYGTTTLKNVLFYDNAVDVSNGPATDTYCATSNDNTKGLSAAGTGNRFSQTFSFTNAAGNNFSLTSSDAGARNYGVTDPGSGLFSDDIIGTTRS